MFGRPPGFAPGSSHSASSVIWKIGRHWMVKQTTRMALMGHGPRTVHWGYTHEELPAEREAIRRLEEW